MHRDVPIVQPGVAISVYKRRFGTLGPLALTTEGEIVRLMTSHQLGPSKEGETLFLYPEMVPLGRVGKKTEIKYSKGPPKGRRPAEVARHPQYKQLPHDTSLRIRGIEDDLPVVLKKPIEPSADRILIKSGAATGITESKVIHASKDVTVTFSDGSEAEFIDQIMTGNMGTDGDSGSFVLSRDTFEPVSLLFAGNRLVTFHNKLTNVAKTGNLKGFFSPISLPRKTPPSLRFIVSSILPDGFFMQKKNLLKKHPYEIMQKLGIGKITPIPNGGFDVFYEDLALSNIPHTVGDEGSVISQDDKVCGLVVGGSKKATVVMKISKVLDALDLELIASFTKTALHYVHQSGYWRTRCRQCNATIAPGAICRFCGKQ